MTRRHYWSQACLRVGTALVTGMVTMAALAQDAPSSAVDVAALRSAASAGDSDAAFKLGTLYAAGYDVVQDYLASARWLRAAADQGNGDAQCELGLLYQTSTYADTPPQDLVDAAQWYEKSAGLGNGCGELALGALYQSGQGKPHDAAKAQALFNAAAAQGYVLDKASFPVQQLYGHFHDMARHLAGVTEVP